ncbi:DUF1963 domain-containing protein [Methylocystis parvus]|uniref:DUF1963 domain-containing protein n=1 Tax=Methylocystis parvus TaxID=134 RepID=A0A6B8M3W2_9HYPH|nr:DUF1963 domain-containing protein [Methylocystis parvus]QGM98584.1 DUF1963 domain-containing protein [Methylocystis parvus]WBK01073.1 DUF1963 domain-containing protein [Methylocystis parvus OBBP]
MAGPPTLILSRRPRHAGAEWRNATSWFGGAPRLGGIEWPRNGAGQPMHFLAQIDLAEIAAKAGETPLPKEGSLAFFVFVGGERAVIYAPDHMSGPPTEPPAGMADLPTVGGDPEWPFDLTGRALFPFWPIDVTRLDIDAPEGADEEERMKAQNAAVAKRFARRKYSLSPSAVFAGPPIPDWWRCAIFVADQLDAAVRNAPKTMADGRRMLAYTQGKLEEARRQEADAIEQAQSAVNRQESGAGLLSRLLFGRREAAQDGRSKNAPGQPQRKLDEARRKAAEAVKSAEASVALYERKIEKLHRLLPGLIAFAAEVADWTRGRDPWSLMSADDRAQLARYSARMTEFPEYTIQYGVTPLDYIKTRMFAKLPKPDDPGFAMLPADVRAVISGRLAPRPQWWRSTILYTESLQKAVAKGEPPSLKTTREKLAAGGVEKAEALAKLLAQETSFPEFAADFAAWAKGRDPWRMMSDEEGVLLWARLERLRTEFRDVASACRVDRFETPERTTLLEVLTAEDEIYETLPAHAREQINREYLLPIDIMHQMFGEPVFIQGDSCAQAEEGKHLLLQLGFDDLMFWSFGDNGDYQFWISPEDLARRNWDGVTMTFECH